MRTEKNAGWIWIGTWRVFWWHEPACKERQDRVKGNLTRSVYYGLHNLSSKRLKVSDRTGLIFFLGAGHPSFSHSFLLSEDSVEASGEMTIRHHLRSHLLLTRGWTSLFHTGAAFRTFNASPHTQLRFYPSVIQATVFVRRRDHFTPPTPDVRIILLFTASLLPISMAWFPLIWKMLPVGLIYYYIIYTKWNQSGKTASPSHQAVYLCSTNAAHLQESVSD